MIAVIGASVVLAPNGYAVLARSRAAALAAGVTEGAIAYEYGAGLGDTEGVLLANGASGSITIWDGAEPIAAAGYGGWFSEASGSSIQLAGSAESAPDAGSWCLSAHPWATGSDRGTPGAPNDCAR